MVLRRFSGPRTKLLAARCECLNLIKINCFALGGGRISWGGGGVSPVTPTYKVSCFMHVIIYCIKFRETQADAYWEYSKFIADLLIYIIF
jgi:hypothetical protein